MPIDRSPNASSAVEREKTSCVVVVCEEESPKPNGFRDSITPPPPHCLDWVCGSTPHEYVKLFLTGLNYSVPGITRVVLESALTATNEGCRKWATRFLEVLISLKVIPDVEAFCFRLLFQQLSDPAAKVVRHAVRILNRWLPEYPKARSQLRNVRLETLGDTGVLLEAFLIGDEDFVRIERQRTKESLRIWMDTFNERYVDVVEEEMRVALTNVKRTQSGRFARLSNERTVVDRIRPPFHILQSLSSHFTGQQLLFEEDVVRRLYSQLTRPLTHPNSQRQMKAALFGLAHIIGSLEEPAAKRILPADTIALMCDVAERAEILSVRGTAFLALNLAACSPYAVRQLVERGWEVNRQQTMQDALNARLRSETFGGDIMEPPEPSFDADSVDNEEGMRKCRSNSMYTRAANEQLTALRHSTMAGPSGRRRTTSTSLIGPLKSVAKATPAAVVVEFDGEEAEEEDEIEEMQFGAQIYGVLDENLHKPEEILRRQSMEWRSDQKAEADRSAQRDFLRYVRGTAAFDNFWVLSDGETADLMSFRSVLSGLDSTKSLQTLLKKTAEQSDYSQQNLLTEWTVVTLPREIQFITENIYGEAVKENTEIPPLKFPAAVMNPQPRASRASSSLRPPSVDQSGSVSPLPRKASSTGSTITDAFDFSNLHDVSQCPRCSHSAADNSVSPFTGAKITERMDIDYAIRRSDILASISLMEIREVTSQTRLANHFRDCPHLFAHPCLYIDVLDLLRDLNFNNDSRSFVQQLFWRCLCPSPNAEPPS